MEHVDKVVMNKYYIIIPTNLSNSTCQINPFHYNPNSDKSSRVGKSLNSIHCEKMSKMSHFNLIVTSLIELVKVIVGRCLIRCLLAELHLVYI